MVDELPVSGDTGAISTESAPIETESSTSNEPAAVAPVTPAEKMIPQSQVNKIAAREAHQAAERARRDAYAEFERNQQGTQQTQQQTPSLGGMQQHDPEQIRQMIRQEAHALSQQAMADKIAQNFESKMEATKAKYPDFDEKYAALNIEQHPELVLWTQGMDNVGDVMYDIASNPEKVASVLMLARGGFPQLAQQKLFSLSASIQANENAKKVPTAPDPIDQVKPSNIGADNGNMGVADFQRQDWLRG